MIKRLRVTVDGSSYDVTVEVADEAPTQPAAAPAPVISAPQPPPQAAAPAPAPSPAPKPAAPSGPGDVPSPLAGRVAAIIVQAGQEVKEGEHLLTLEAMKMNTFVFAPRAGKVAAIQTEVGAAVEEGQVLITIG